VQRKAQPWITAKGKRSNKTPKKLTVQLQNRFRGVRSENSTEDRKLRGKLKGPQTLIVGDLAIKDHCCRKPNCEKPRTTHRVRSLNAEVFISGPLPPVRGGTEKFSRLLALNTWLSTACDVHSIHFIDNFNHFWDRRHLFKGDRLSLNKSGVKHVTDPTHIKGHTLDLIISKGLNISEVEVTDVALSDHYCVFF
uniref:Endonuclease/exonuclease/phosphatase domain-containing protein n=1 Tax=Mastacembelus armatus TaxID=205130 RepID=A0A3Q3RT53_9TELE